MMFFKGLLLYTARAEILYLSWVLFIFTSDGL